MSTRAGRLLVVFAAARKDIRGVLVEFNKVVVSVDGMHFQDELVRDKELIVSVQRLSDQARKFIENDIRDPLMEDMGFERV